MTTCEETNGEDHGERYLIKINRAIKKWRLGKAKLKKNSKEQQTKKYGNRKCQHVKHRDYYELNSPLKRQRP